MAVTRRNDITIALFLVAIIFMMILPMPTFLVDTMIAFNMGAAIVLLMVGVYIATPLSFSVFPSVLLLTTLFRLALSITTTRLILLQADAGHVVSAFGNFVVAGNLIVGIVVFLIITLVQFIVITKGSERVAEVSARFSLDAMPGKQMSIDSDLRAGVITLDQARRRRADLEKESQLYGSMDGAMKFVKGDAIAGLCIIVVNILGGISIGVLQMDMSAAEALQLYTILTVGDGLVSQIPALFIAITAGIVVTRVTTEESTNLGADIGTQILAQPNALLIGALLLGGFSLIPGFPTLIFLLLGLLLGGISLTLKSVANAEQKDPDEVFAKVMTLPQPGEANNNCEKSQELSLTVPLVLNLAHSDRGIIPSQILNRELNKLSTAFYRDLGIPFPGFHMGIDDQQPPNTYSIRLHDVPVAQGVFLSNHLLVPDSAEQLELLNILHQQEADFLPGLGARWVAEQYSEALREADIKTLDTAGIVIYHLAWVLRKYAHEFIGIQETRCLLDQMESQCAELVNEVQRILPLHKLTDILKRLVAENISIRNLRSILEALVEWGQKEKDSIILTEYVRGSLKRHISYKYTNGHNILPAYLLDPSVEDTIRNGIRQSPAGSFLALEPAVTGQFIEQIKQAVGDVNSHACKPILLTAMDIRRYVRKLMELDFYEMPVLSYQELSPEVTVQPLNRIELS
jgi:type III secretion protein V